jgi:hypothetical protein
MVGVVAAPVTTSAPATIGGRNVPQFRRRLALTLNLKAAIVAAGFILMLVLTRRRGAE